MPSGQRRQPNHSMQSRIGKVSGGSRVEKNPSGPLRRLSIGYKFPAGIPPFESLNVLQSQFNLHGRFLQEYLESHLFRMSDHGAARVSNELNQIVSVIRFQERDASWQPVIGYLSNRRIKRKSDGPSHPSSRESRRSKSPAPRMGLPDATSIKARTALLPLLK